MRWIILLLAACSIYAQTAPTTVSDTITSAGGLHPSGTITVSWGRYQDDSTPRRVIFPGSKTIVVTNGTFSTSLFPNSVALPSGGCFVSAYHLTGTGFTNQTRYWYVPASPTPVNLNDVESSLPCTPQSGILISPAQINGGNAQPGQALIWNGFYFSPGTVSGGGGSAPGGTNGQLQFNNLGALGGFTPIGDCVLNRPSFICVSTNGVPFAASATIDTTNASNITTGILGIGRGSTGTSTAFTQGSIVFAGISGVYSQDNGNLFWNSGSHLLGIGTTSPGASLDIQGNSLIQLNLKGQAGTSENLLLTDGNGFNTWNLTAGITGDLSIGDVSHSITPVTVKSGGINNALTLFQTGDLTLSGGNSSPTDSGYRLDIQRRGASGLMQLFDQTASTGVTDVLIKAGAGQATTPFILLKDNTNANIAQIGVDGFAAFGGGVRTVILVNNMVGLGSSGQIGFRNAASWDSGAIDVAMQRSGIGLIEINSGTLGAFRDLKVRSLTSTVLSGAGNQCVSVDNTGLLVVSGTGPCFAGSSFTAYSQTVSAQTAVTITAATHARGTTPVATCLDNATPKNVVSCAYTRNVSGDLVFAFNPAFSGTLEVRQ